MKYIEERVIKGKKAISESTEKKPSRRRKKIIQGCQKEFTNSNKAEPGQLLAEPD